MAAATETTQDTGVGAVRARPRRPRGPVALVTCAVLLVAAVVLSFAVGPLRVPPAEVLQIVAAKLGLTDGAGLDQRNSSVVWQLRMPRALLGAVVGASLAVAGAALQGLFGNALADPGVIGVSSGASLGAVGAIVLGVTVLGSWTIPVAAFVGGALATALIYVLARSGGGEGTVTLLLVGIAIGAACSAVTGFFTYIADTEELEALTFWSMGSLGRADWVDLGASLPLFVLGLVSLLLLARPLDLLALGERQAQHLGIDVARTRLLLVVVAAMLVGAAVAFAGSVGFVGLVVPHVVRLLVGPGHRWLLPVAAVLGALLVVLADTAARTLDPPQEIPLGLFTAALGAPFFLWLVRRNRPRAAL